MNLFLYSPFIISYLIISFSLCHRTGPHNLPDQGWYNSAHWIMKERKTGEKKCHRWRQGKARKAQLRRIKGKKRTQIDNTSRIDSTSINCSIWNKRIHKIPYMGKTKKRACKMIIKVKELRHFDIRHIANWPTDRPSDWGRSRSLLRLWKLQDTMHAALRCLKWRNIGKEEHVSGKKCTEEIVIVEAYFLKYSRSQGSLICLMYSDEIDAIVWSNAEHTAMTDGKTIALTVNSINRMTVQVGCDKECQHRTRQGDIET